MLPKSRRKILKSSGALVGAGVLAGCTGGDDSDAGDTPTDDGGMGTGTPTASLEERAQEEGLVLEATAVTGIVPFYETFEDDTGLKHQRFRNTSDRVATRLIQEHNANQLAFDYHLIGAANTGLRLADEGLYRDVPAAIQDEYPDRIGYNNKVMSAWIGLPLTLLYNSERVDEPPTTLEGLAANHGGEYAVDTRDWFIWTALRQMHGESTAEEMVSSLGDGAVWYSSHYGSAKAVVGGELSMALTYAKMKNTNLYPEFEGPMVEQKLSDMPTILKDTPAAIFNNAEHPAAAQYYMQYTAENITDIFVEQDMRLEENLYSAQEVKGSDEYFIRSIQNAADLDLTAEEERWQELAGFTA